MKIVFLLIGIANLLCVISMGVVYILERREDDKG